MSYRAARRRKKRTGPGPDPPRFHLGRTERIALGFAAIGLVACGIAAVVLLTLTSGGSTDEDTIHGLAQRSIEVLPAGQWPSLYDDFTASFQQRCSLAAFTQAGVDNAKALGASLQQLEFQEMKGLSITGDSATGTIVGRYHNIPGSDYSIEAAFAREGGAWKITPAPNTTGCQAFNILNDTATPSPTP